MEDGVVGTFIWIFIFVVAFVALLKTALGCL